MLTLTKKTEYALMALAHLARHDARVCSTREMARHYRIPHALLMNIMKRMTQHDLVTSVRGARGGYRLALPPDCITLAQLIRALEGPVRLVQCADHDGTASGNPCELNGCCSIQPTLLQIHDEFEAFLDTITLARLAPRRVTPITVRRSATLSGSTARADRTAR